MNKNQEIISSVIEQLYRISNKISRLEKEPVDFGTGEKLTPSEIHLLDAVSRGMGDTVSALCSCFGTTMGAVSQVVSKMEQMGYINKVRSDLYYKEKILTLTAKGKTAVKGHSVFHKTKDKHFTGILEELTSDEVKLFRRVLSRIGDQMDRYLDGR